MNKQNIIKELLELWGNCIGCSYHKQKDFKFSIITQFTVYQDETYVVEHHGYVLHQLPTYVTFNSLEDAQDYLIQVLIYGISREVEDSLNFEITLDDRPDLPKERATEIKSRLMGLIEQNGLNKQLDAARLMG
jgi:hypothetical protein